MLFFAFCRDVPWTQLQASWAGRKKPKKRINGDVVINFWTIKSAAVIRVAVRSPTLPYLQLAHVRMFNDDIYIYSPPRQFHSCCQVWENGTRNPILLFSSFPFPFPHFLFSALLLSTLLFCHFPFPFYCTNYLSAIFLSPLAQPAVNESLPFFSIINLVTKKTVWILQEFSWWGRRSHPF